MAIERPTFHESWYRVAELHPRLRSTVQISRQHFRGLAWHVVQDHTNNAFFRLAEPAYRFIGLLDGKRSVAEAWKTVNETVGDDAPTQGEVIQLLGQLYTANLLQAEVPADTHTLFARYKKRKQREITGYLMNIMFARLPIFDPDQFLNKWLPLLGWIFSPIGLVVWLVLIGFGIHSIANYPGWASKISDGASGLLSPENLAMLYVGFALIKACHEMGHAISCKKFGRQSGTGGEVHVIGIMFLVFTPVPYVDASSSWALTNKWHRAIVGAAGMWVELAIASVAAMVWANTPDKYWLHNFAYNVMFVASFSTIVFNANPLLRYDGYYILSDLLEIPNLSQRSKDYIFYLVKRYAWNVRQARNPAHGSSEKFWMFVYAIASFAMRIIVTFSIMFYLTTVLEGTLIILAAGMAIAGLITWAFVPIGKFIYYLTTSTELSRVRARAVVSSFLVLGTALVVVGFVPVPDRARSQGVAEPANMADLFAGDNGFVSLMAMDGRKGRDPLADALAMPWVEKDTLLIRASNRELQTQLEQLLADRQGYAVNYNMALAKEPDKAPLVKQQIAGKDEQIQLLRDRLAALELKAPLDGVLIAPDLDDKHYGYIKRTDRLGTVADIHHLIIRAAVNNDLAGLTVRSTDDDQQSLNRVQDLLVQHTVEIRLQGRPDILLSGTISSVGKAGSNQLPSASLGYQLGGEFNTASDDRKGTKTTENFFEVRIDHLKLVEAPKEIRDRLKGTDDVPLLPGQRVVVRFDFTPKPIASQAWTKLLQVFQKRFQI